MIAFVIIKIHFDVIRKFSFNKKMGDDHNSERGSNATHADRLYSPHCFVSNKY